MLWLLGLPGAPLVASAALGEAVLTVWLEVVHHRLQWSRLHWHVEVRGSGALAVDEGLDLGAIDVDGDHLGQVLHVGRLPLGAAAALALEKILVGVRLAAGLGAGRALSLELVVPAFEELLEAW